MDNKLIGDLPPIDDNKREVVKKGREHKETLKDKIKNTFIPDDIKSVRDYFILGVIVPAGKKFLDDMWCKMILGQNRRGYNDYFTFDYNSISRPYRGSKNIWDRPSARFDDFPRNDYNRNKNFNAHRTADVRSYTDAKEVLEHLQYLIDTYGCASIYDFKKACGLSTDYVNKSYGWVDISTAKIISNTDGWFTIKMPEISYIK